MVAWATGMAESVPTTTSYHALFQRHQLETGESRLSQKADAPKAIPDPTGRLLHIATVDAGAHAICPSCDSTGRGAFVSFVQDLRLAYACPNCQEFVWLKGA